MSETRKARRCATTGCATITLRTYCQKHRAASVSQRERDALKRAIEATERARRMNNEIRKKISRVLPAA